MNYDMSMGQAGAIRLKEGVTVAQSDQIKRYLPDSAINDSDQKEFLSNSEFEANIKGAHSGMVTFNDILRKSEFIRTYLECIDLLQIEPSTNILELGADHGWASVIIKANHPDCHVVCSDLVPDCVRHSSRYEALLQAFLDEKWAFSVRDIPFADQQFDRVFTFAAFHHFGDHCDFRGSLGEIARVLRPGGKIILLYEPSTPGLLHSLAYRRVNRIRAHDQVDEDVLVPTRLAALCHDLKLSVKCVPFPIHRFRPSLSSTLYYTAISKVKALQTLLPCTYNYVLTKQHADTFRNRRPIQ
jgi:SAM-dependent methyltransferase